MRNWIIPVSVYRPPQPNEGLRITTEMKVRLPGMVHPYVRESVTGTDAERLFNVRLGFLGATEKQFGEPNKGVGGGEVSIER